MPIRSDKNLYPGINPHLNSFLQQKGGGWQSFHKDNITYLREMLDVLLPEGYYATTEISLQIGTYDPDIDIPLRKPTMTIPDVAVYQSAPQTGFAVESTAGMPTLTIPLMETVDDLEEISSTVIYRIEDGELPGKPVTRIELLSPANKPPGSYSGDYLIKRAETLYSGLHLVEIDYLHENHPLFAHIPDYSARTGAAYPYHFIISDPHPTLHEGRVHVYSFGVFDPIPVVAIPLAGGDAVRVDFGAVYNRTFESSRLFRRLVDYEQQPVNFDAYHWADQEHIRAKMAEITASMGES